MNGRLAANHDGRMMTLGIELPLAGVAGANGAVGSGVRRG